MGINIIQLKDSKYRSNLFVATWSPWSPPLRINEKRRPKKRATRSPTWSCGPADGVTKIWISWDDHRASSKIFWGEPTEPTIHNLGLDSAWHCCPKLMMLITVMFVNSQQTKYIPLHPRYQCLENHLACLFTISKLHSHGLSLKSKVFFGIATTCQVQSPTTLRLLLGPCTYDPQDMSLSPSHGTHFLEQN